MKTCGYSGTDNIIVACLPRPNDKYLPFRKVLPHSLSAMRNSPPLLTLLVNLLNQLSRPPRRDPLQDLALHLLRLDIMLLLAGGELRMGQEMIAKVIASVEALVTDPTAPWLQLGMHRGHVATHVLGPVERLVARRTRHFLAVRRRQLVREVDGRRQLERVSRRFPPHGCRPVAFALAHSRRRLRARDQLADRFVHLRVRWEAFLGAPGLWFDLGPAAG